MDCLIVFNSVTYAQSAASLLAKCGIVTRLTRSPTSVGAGSCSYGLRLGRHDLSRAAAILHGSPIQVRGMFTTLPNGDYRSVSL